MFNRFKTQPAGTDAPLMQRYRRDSDCLIPGTVDAAGKLAPDSSVDVECQDRVDAGNHLDEVAR